MPSDKAPLRSHTITGARAGVLQEVGLAVLGAMVPSAVLFPPETVTVYRQ